MNFDHLGRREERFFSLGSYEHRLSQVAPYAINKQCYSALSAGCRQANFLAVANFLAANFLALANLRALPVAVKRR